MDPYTVLNLPRGFTLEQLKYNYKVLARQLHPDKCGARISREQATATFQVLTAAYRALLAEHEMRVADKPFYELRDRAREKREEPQDVAGKSRFDLTRFNNVFDETRVGDEEFDNGYADWMTRTDPGDRREAERNRQLVKYVEPEPVTVSRKGTAKYSELGTGRVKDYSRNDVVNTSQAVQFTDYRVAHTTSKLADEQSWATLRPDFRSIDELQSHRAAMPMVMTPEEASAQAARAAKAKAREDRRSIALIERDAAVAAHYERAHTQLLGYSPSVSGLLKR